MGRLGALCAAPTAYSTILGQLLQKGCAGNQGWAVAQYTDQNTKAGVDRAVGVELRHALGPLLGALV